VAGQECNMRSESSTVLLDAARGFYAGGLAETQQLG
jgi:hypothetical protein